MDSFDNENIRGKISPKTARYLMSINAQGGKTGGLQKATHMLQIQIREQDEGGKLSGTPKHKPGTDYDVHLTVTWFIHKALPVLLAGGGYAERIKDVIAEIIGVHCNFADTAPPTKPRNIKKQNEDDDKTYALLYNPKAIDRVGKFAQHREVDRHMDDSLMDQLDRLLDHTLECHYEFHRKYVYVGRDDLELLWEHILRKHKGWTDLRECYEDGLRALAQI